MIKLHVLMKSALGLRKKERKFVVTPKTRGQSSGFWEVWPQAVIVAMACISIAVGLARMPGAPSLHQWGIWISLFWAFYWLALTYPVVRRALKKREARVAYRFGGRIDVPIRFHSAEADGQTVARGYATNLNRYGLSITQDRSIPVGALLNLQITLPQCEVAALGRVVRNDSFQAGKHLTCFVNGIKFEQVRIQDQDEISKYLFGEVAPKQGQWLRLTHKTQTEPMTTEPNLDLMATAKILPSVFLLCFLWVPEAYAQGGSDSVRKGNQFLDQGRPVAAIAYFQQALIEDPVDAAALRGMGKTRERQGKFTDAAEFYGRAVTLGPQDSESWYGLGRVQGWRGERAEAYSAFEKALSLDPNNSAIQLAYAEALGWDPALRHKSIALYRSILAQHPGLASAENGLAQVLAWSGHAQEAAKTYDGVLQKEPANTQALLGKAEMAQWTERHLEARELLMHAQQTSPADPHVLSLLGKTEVSLGQYEQASALADQLAPLDADSSSRLADEIRH
ncbi:MAG TPA: tetratricopeptide repeat protein, partial [Anaerolineales bacterium]